MNKRFISLLMCFILTLAYSIPVLATDELDENKNKFQELSAQIKELDTEISKLNNEIYDLEAKISLNEKNISQTLDEIETNKLKISTLETDISDTQDVLSIRLREMYKNGSNNTLNFLSFILESEGLSDFFSRVNSINTIVKLDNKLIEDNSKMIEELNSSTASLNAKKEELDKLNDEIKSSLLLVKEKQNTVLSSKNKLDSELVNISELIANNERYLVNKQLAIANSSDSSLKELKNAVMDLKGILPQITSASVKSEINSAIKNAEYRISQLEYLESNSNNNNSNNNNNDNNSNDDSSGSSDGSYLATYTMEATAYYGHGITASGTVPVRDPNGLSTVAVDPKVIPLGSKVYIPGYGYAIAADTGGAIKGNKIDLYMNTREECYAFGRRNVTVNVISYP